MAPGPENPYSDQNIRFPIPYFRPDSQNVYPISDPVMCGKFGNCQQIYGVRDFVTPQTMFVSFFFAINVHGSTRYCKNGIPGQIDGIYTLFQTKMAKSIPYFRLEVLENETLFGGTYLYGLYMEYLPATFDHAWFVCADQNWSQININWSEWHGNLTHLFWEQSTHCFCGFFFYRTAK